VTAPSVEAPPRQAAKGRLRRSPLAPPRVPTLLYVLNEMSNVCGTYAGWRHIWCPHCCGFAGCAYVYKVPCPTCAGGSVEPIRW
jgi:hypothetical protein